MYIVCSLTIHVCVPHLVRYFFLSLVRSFVLSLFIYVFRSCFISLCVRSFFLDVFLSALFVVRLLFRYFVLIMYVLFR